MSKLIHIVKATLRQHLLPSSGALNVVVLRFVGLFLNFVLLLLISKKFEVSTVAEVMVALSIIAFTRIAMVFGTDITLVRHLSALATSGRRTATVSFIRNIFIVFLVSLLVNSCVATIIIPLFQGYELLPSYLLAAASCALIHLNAEYFRAFGNMRAASLLGGGNGGILGCCCALMPIVMLKANADVIRVVQTIAIAMALAASLATLFSWIRSSKRFNNQTPDAEPNEDRRDIPTLWSLAKESSHCFTAQIFGESRSASALWMVAGLGTDLQTASFGIAQRLVNPLSMLLSMCESIVAPKLALAHRSKTLKQLEKSLRFTSLAAALPVVAVMVGLLFLGEGFLRLAFDDVGTTLFAICVFLSIGQLAFVLGGPSSLALNMIGKSHFVASLAVGLLVMQITVGYFATVFYGAVGMALTVMAIQCVTKFATNLLLYRSAGIVVFASIPKWISVNSTFKRVFSSAT